MIGLEAPKTGRMQRAAWKTATVVLAVTACGFAAWALRQILTPFMLAVFLLLIIDNLAGSVRRHIPILPKRLATPAALAIIVAFFVVTMWMAVSNGAEFVLQAGTYEKRINEILVQVGARLGLQVPPTVHDLVHLLDPTKYLGALAEGAQGVASGAFVTLLYLAFLVASRSNFSRKGLLICGSAGTRNEAAHVFERIRHGVACYIWVQTMAGLLIAAPAGLLMAACGLQHTFFWALLIFTLSYIPVVGGAIGTLLPPFFALLQFPDLAHPLIIFAGLQAIGLIVGNIIQPRMQGSSLNLDPVAIFLALAFWGTLWGLPGAFLSTPLTVTAMAIMAQFRATEWIAVLLSSNGEPFADTESRAAEIDVP